MISKATVRQHVEKINGVSRTWFELNLEESALVRNLVVEVEFDTDPNNSHFSQNVLDAIVSTARGVLENETIVSHLKIVPKSNRQPASRSVSIGLSFPLLIEINANPSPNRHGDGHGYRTRASRTNLRSLRKADASGADNSRHRCPARTAHLRLQAMRCSGH